MTRDDQARAEAEGLRVHFVAKAGERSACGLVVSDGRWRLVVGDERAFDDVAGPRCLNCLARLTRGSQS